MKKIKLLFVLLVAVAIGLLIFWLLVGESGL
ncbi:ABC-type transporter Mla subunit MlaD [Planomicrobium stackebrandtii]|uniref:ABC-type transporter Mla subunit MlaD n=1 Tax=Planomicrobium stackebrandtii TaxID=253160 RepID=A0ABU0GTY7_9BACL|nr:ABC-type transporter Mla subunit MlaD [Planomicrobium stackebrandtii]